MWQFVVGLGSALLLTFVWFALVSAGTSASNDDAVLLLVAGAVAILLAGVFLLVSTTRRALAIGIIVGAPLGLLAHALLFTASIGA